MTELGRGRRTRGRWDGAFGPRGSRERAEWRTALSEACGTAGELTKLVDGWKIVPENGAGSGAAEEDEDARGAGGDENSR